MACCLMATSHYLNQWWHIISRVLRHSLQGNSTENAHESNHYNVFENYAFKIKLKATSLGRQWVNAKETSTPMQQQWSYISFASSHHYGTTNAFQQMAGIILCMHTANVRRRSVVSHWLGASTKWSLRWNISDTTVSSHHLMNVCFYYLFRINRRFLFIFSFSITISLFGNSWVGMVDRCKDC